MDINNCRYEMINYEGDGINKCRWHGTLPQVFREFDHRKGFTGTLVVSCPKCLSTHTQQRTYGEGKLPIIVWNEQNDPSKPLEIYE